MSGITGPNKSASTTNSFISADNASVQSEGRDVVEFDLDGNFLRVQANMLGTKFRFPISFPSRTSDVLRFCRGWDSTQQDFQSYKYCINGIDVELRHIERIFAHDGLQNVDSDAHKELYSNCQVCCFSLTGIFVLMEE